MDIVWWWGRMLLLRVGSLLVECGILNLILRMVLSRG